jgi:hypothetical protein
MWLESAAQRSHRHRPIFHIRLLHGCTGALIPQSFMQMGQVVQVILKLEVNPTCDYELMVSFVVAIERPLPGYTLSIQVI